MIELLNARHSTTETSFLVFTLRLAFQVDVNHGKAMLFSVFPQELSQLQASNLTFSQIKLLIKYIS